MHRVILPAMLLLACVTPDRPPLPRTPAPSTPQLASNYYETIELSAQAAQSRGYPTTLQMMEQVRPNYWRVRFGSNGAGKGIDIYFDGTRREVIEAKEIDLQPVGGE